MITKNNNFNKKKYQYLIKKKVDDFKLSDLMISIEGSNICNSRCLMCPYSKMTRKKEIMSMNFFKKIALDCMSNGIINFNFNFYNEPFLDPFIFERIKFLKSKGSRVQLFSNGSIINNKKAIKILKSGLDEIIFSIDAIKKETYESIRKGLNFEITVKNILNLIRQKEKLGLKNLKIKLNFVVQKLNRAELEKFQSFWVDKVDKIYISHDDQRNKINRSLKIINKDLSSFPCLRLWSELIVMSNGKVPLCCVDYDGEIVLGDFNKQNLNEIWNSSRFKKIRKQHFDFKADQISLCEKCLNSYRMNIKIMEHK